MEGARFLCLQRWGLVSGEGSDSCRWRGQGFCVCRGGVWFRARVRTLVDGGGKVFVSAEVGFGFGRGFGLSRLVDCDDPELVPLALAQPRHPGLELVDGRHAVLVVRDEGVEPAAELV